jgi:hypothetical protein
LGLDHLNRLTIRMSDKLNKEEVKSLKTSVIDILDLYYRQKVPEKGETIQIQIKNDAQVCSFTRPVCVSNMYSLPNIVKLDGR